MTAVIDIVTHVVIHGAYHRGQIAKMVARAGGRRSIRTTLLGSGVKAEWTDESGRASRKGAKGEISVSVTMAARWL
jgi:hypothetical protein